MEEWYAIFVKRKNEQNKHWLYCVLNKNHDFHQLSACHSEIKCYPGGKLKIGDIF